MAKTAEPVLRLDKLYKDYSGHIAVNEVSFEVGNSGIFGILGPNGAGKTSTIRMITGITKIDAGQIYFEGQPLRAEHIRRIGYMPEERGLYKKMKVGEQILYLARLKGLSKKEAKERIAYWSERLDIGGWMEKPIEDLSKGMQQKIQFVCTVVHNPKLLILDEPFSGLDPVNAKLIQSEIDELHKQGTAIIFSTHRMEQVEQICDEIVLINAGRNVLQGSVEDIKQRYKRYRYRLRFVGELPDISEVALPAFRWLQQEPGEASFELEEASEDGARQALYILQALLERNLLLLQFEEVLPSLNDIFVEVVQGSAH